MAEDWKLKSNVLHFLLICCAPRDWCLSEGHAERLPLHGAEKSDRQRCGSRQPRPKRPQSPSVAERKREHHVAVLAAPETVSRGDVEHAIYDRGPRPVHCAPSPRHAIDRGIVVPCCVDLPQQTPVLGRVCP